MRVQSGASANCANFDVEQSCDIGRTAMRAKVLTTEVMRHAHAMWKTNIRLHLAAYAGVAPRTVDHWEAGEREISTEAFLTLLDSEVGMAFIEIFMASLRPEVRKHWWDQQVLLAKLDRARQHKVRAEERERQLSLALKR